MKNKIITWLWLKRLDIRKFADTVGVDYGTAYRWVKDGRQPKLMARHLIEAKFPDCPLLKVDAR